MAIRQIYAYGKARGEYDDVTGIYKPYTKYQHHVMGKFGGGGSFGISQVIIDDLKQSGCHTVMMFYKGKRGDKLLKASLDQWINSPHKHLDKEVDWQKFVCINDMEDVYAKKEIPPTQPTQPPSLPPSDVTTKQTELKW